jgi:KaiC/GvpD/RAD55 family RecA-like ATPase
MKQQVSLLRAVQGKVRQFERRGNEYWASCPLPSHQGRDKTPSFAIKVKDGCEVFFCQGCGQGGDIITWYQTIDALTKAQAIEKLKAQTFNPDMQATLATNQADADKYSRVGAAFPNIVDNDNKPKVKLDIEKWLPFEEALRNNDRALIWLHHMRGITKQTAIDMHLGYAQTCTGHLDPEFEPARNSGWILFPRFDDERKNIIACKLRGMDVKAFSQWAHMDPKALFNAGCANALEDLFVTEGEFDACIMEQAGFRAVSIPNASTKLTPDMKAVMKRANRVFLAGDNDGSVGRKAMSTLAREMGSNTFIIEWPEVKDANDFYRGPCDRNVDVFRAQVQVLMKAALSTPVENFTSLIARLQAAGKVGTDLAGNPHRLHFPWAGVDNMSYANPGTVVCFYSTYSGTGKTVLATQVMLAEAKRGETVVVFSPEVRDEQYLALVAAQTIGPMREGGLNRATKITPQDYLDTVKELDVPTEAGGELQYYVGHSLPVTDGEKLLDFIEVICMATGATRFVIDTLHRLVTPTGRESAVDAEGRTMRKLEELGIKYGLIFIVIGQSNKEAEDLKEVRKDAPGVLRGSREITDICDSVYLFHRKRNQTAEAAEGVDLLEAETTVALIKGRIQGPTGKFAKLVYKKEHSKFYPLQFGSAHGNVTEGGALPLDGEANF